MRTTHGRWAALVAAGGLTLTGCAIGSSGDESVAPHTTAGHQTSGSAGAESESDSGSTASNAKQSGDSSSSDYKAPTDARIARTASLSLTVEDLEQASAKVRSAAGRAGGYVSDEDSRTATYEGGRSWAEITVTVPVDELESTIADLSEIGEVTKRSSSAEDLTSQYTDTAARVKTKTKSVERLRDLIDSTDDLEQIVKLERELATREADLESMTGQQKVLEKRTATAPVTVSLSTVVEHADDEAEDETGFVAGLSEGWAAFTSALTVGLTALGAITPFAVAGMVLLAPIVLWWRRRPRRAAAAVATSATSQE